MNNFLIRSFFYITILFITMFTWNSAILEATKEYLNYEQVATLCKELSTIIKADDYNPDLLIGLSRGGLLPLGILAGENQLNLRHVSVIALKSYEGKQQGEMNIVMPIHLEDYQKYTSILI